MRLKAEAKKRKKKRFKAIRKQMARRKKLVDMFVVSTPEVDDDEAQAGFPPTLLKSQGAIEEEEMERERQKLRDQRLAEKQHREWLQERDLQFRKMCEWCVNHAKLHGFKPSRKARHPCYLGYDESGNAITGKTYSAKAAVLGAAKREGEGEGGQGEREREVWGEEDEQGKYNEVRLRSDDASTSHPAFFGRLVDLDDPSLLVAKIDELAAALEEERFIAETRRMEKEEEEEEEEGEEGKSSKDTRGDDGAEEEEERENARSFPNETRRDDVTGEEEKELMSKDSTARFSRKMFSLVARLCGIAGSVYTEQVKAEAALAAGRIGRPYGLIEYATLYAEEGPAVAKLFSDDRIHKQQEKRRIEFEAAMREKAKERRVAAEKLQKVADAAAAVRKVGEERIQKWLKEEEQHLLEQYGEEQFDAYLAPETTALSAAEEAEILKKVTAFQAFDADGSGEYVSERGRNERKSR